LQYKFFLFKITTKNCKNKEQNKVMAPNLFGKMFNKFYRFCSEPKTKFYFHLIYGILAIHLTVYAVALARYEFIVFSFDTKITNIAMLDGKIKDRALSRIVELSKKQVPVEPVIYNIVSSIKSLSLF